MRKIQLLYVANEIAKKMGFLQQHLSFFIMLKNLAFIKNVDLIWAGEDGVWHTLPATYHSMAEHDNEYWTVTATFNSEPHVELPGDIQFSLRYRVCGKEYWDNNRGLPYRSRVNTCAQMGIHHSLINIGYRLHLADGQKFVPITIVINPPAHAEKVTLHWTTDDWKHTNTTRCYLNSTLELVRDDNTSLGRAQIWKALLVIGRNFRIQYAIRYETGDHVSWDNNAGRNYSSSRKFLNVLALNLHCYQERDQDRKLSQIAKAIDELSIDVVCLQEVAENWNEGRGDWRSNTAKIINDRLASPYHLHTDWSHLGFDLYREGVAILSRYPFSKHDSRYVSNNKDPYNIHARRAVMAQIDVPYIGPVNFYSVHTSWWDDGFPEQFENLRAWASANHGGPIKATLLCGDFNVEAGSRGYELIVTSKEYEDQYLALNSPDIFEKIYRGENQNSQRYLIDDHRIDYIFMKKSSGLRATSGRVVFTKHEYGRVSDHEGYLMTFEPT